MREKIMEYAEGLQNPLGPKVTFRLLDKASDPKGDKLGTYGIIKGAELYIGAKIKREEYAPEALGKEKYGLPEKEEKIATSFIR